VWLVALRVGGMVQLALLTIGVTLTAALLLGLLFSCFVVAVIVASQKVGVEILRQSENTQITFYSC